VYWRFFSLAGTFVQTQAPSCGLIPYDAIFQAFQTLYSDLTGAQNIALYRSSPGIEDSFDGHAGFTSGKEPVGYRPKMA
jgi:hypothetical protein